MTIYGKFCSIMGKWSLYLMIKLLYVEIYIFKFRLRYMRSFPLSLSNYRTEMIAQWFIFPKEISAECRKCCIKLSYSVPKKPFFRWNRHVVGLSRTQTNKSFIKQTTDARAKGKYLNSAHKSNPNLRIHPFHSRFA